MGRKVCIFCGANTGSSNQITKHVKELCDRLVDLDFDLVYGGGKTGLMGIIANIFLQNGKEVIGVRPNKLIQDEDAHQGLKTLIVTESMQHRKAKMIELSDLFIALPGGVGTLDEIIETYTLLKIGFIDKPSAILNTDSYYEGLKKLLDNMVTHQFLDQQNQSKLIFASTPVELLTRLNLLETNQVNPDEIDKVALISIRDGKILSTKSIGKDKYYIPGGKREGNETDEQTLSREIWEELAVEIQSESIEYIGRFRAQADGYHKEITVKMTCYKADFRGIPKASNEIEEIKWLNYQDVNKVSEVDKTIFEFLKLNGELK